MPHPSPKAAVHHAVLVHSASTCCCEGARHFTVIIAGIALRGDKACKCSPSSPGVSKHTLSQCHTGHRGGYFDTLCITHCKGPDAQPEGLRTEPPGKQSGTAAAADNIESTPAGKAAARAHVELQPPACMCARPVAGLAGQGTLVGSCVHAVAPVGACSRPKNQHGGV